MLEIKFKIRFNFPNIEKFPCTLFIRKKNLLIIFLTLKREKESIAKRAKQIVSLIKIVSSVNEMHVVIN